MATAGARARWRERRHACALGGAETSTRRQRGRQVSGGGPGPGRGGAGRLSVSPSVRSFIRPSVRSGEARWRPPVPHGGRGGRPSSHLAVGRNPEGAPGAGLPRAAEAMTLRRGPRRFAPAAGAAGGVWGGLWQRSGFSVGETRTAGVGSDRAFPRRRRFAEERRRPPSSAGPRRPLSVA